MRRPTSATNKSADDRAPHDGRRLQEGQQRDRQNAGDAAEDVETIALKRRELRDTRATPYDAGLTAEVSKKMIPRLTHRGRAAIPHAPSS